MATETFYKRIILSNEAAEKLALGLEKQEQHYWTDEAVLERQEREQRYNENRKRSEEWIRSFLSH